MTEEALVLLEFQDTEMPQQLHHFVMKGLETKRPIVQINDHLFEGRAEQPIGSFLILDGTEHIGNINRVMKVATLQLEEKPPQSQSAT
jgi:hypothetical protein